VRVFLETERLLLRRFAEADVDRLLALHNDLEVMRCINGGKPPSREEVECEYRERFAGDGYWAAVEKATREFVGWFALHPTEGGRPRGARARLPAREVHLGQGLRHRRLSRPDPQGLRRARRAPRMGADDGGQPRLPSGDGEGEPEVRADVPPAVGGPAAGGGARRGRVRAHKGRLGAAGSGRLRATRGRRAGRVKRPPRSEPA
jgi:hypothetical protein